MEVCDKKEKIFFFGKEYNKDINIAITQQTLQR